LNKQTKNSIDKDLFNILDKRVSSLIKAKDSHIVILGGSGFVGTWLLCLISVLNKKFNFNITLTIIDRNKSDIFDKFFSDNKSEINFVNKDVAYISELPSKTNYIIHAACNPDIREHASNPFDTSASIADGVSNILKISNMLSSLKKIMYLSSGLADNNYNQDIYSRSKSFAELLCTSARQQFRAPILIGRPYSFMGPFHEISSPWAQNMFILDAINGKSIRVRGDGNTVRSYMYGADAAFWILSLTINGEIGETYSIGSDKEVRIEELANIISKNFKSDIPVVLNTSKRTESRSSHFVPNTEKERNNFDLEIYTSFESTIKKTVKWYINDGS
tara:strand:+ start:1400 stop:2398 length:999 start_codon:yes stop_codon:yes gene_type:complete